MKRYLKPDSDGGTTFIMVPDQETFRNNAQQAMTHYEQECLLEHHNRHFTLLSSASGRSTRDAVD
eukprot:2688046-Ditylum_brightwellii.AAC.1